MFEEIIKKIVLALANPKCGLYFSYFQNYQRYEIFHFDFDNDLRSKTIFKSSPGMVGLKVSSVSFEGEKMV